MNGKGRLGEQEDGNRKKAEGFIYIVFSRASSLSYSGDNTLMSFKEPFFLYKSEFFLLQWQETQFKLCFKHERRRVGMEERGNVFLLGIERGC